MNIIIKTFILSILWNTVNVGFKSLDKYDVNVKFSIFRSVCCLVMVLYAALNITRYGKEPLLNPFFSTSFDIKDLNEFFVAYLINDLINMAITKTDRAELWFHHIFALITFTLSPLVLKNSPIILNILLLAESLSIVSGVDSMYIFKNEMKHSMYCKKFRKFVIRFIRTPIWIYSIISTLTNYDRLPNLLIINSLAAMIIMPLLDNYWAKKCQKVIDKYDDSEKNLI